jgi:predicted metal-dependent phosphoesterase TrpH
MRIDLHVHTYPRSTCSSIEPMELVREARRIGLDGICLTEHQSLWHLHETEELAKDGGIRIFRGNEITTDQGDILVFGYEEDVQGIVTIQELHGAVTAAGGFMIAAHPFRGFLVFGIGQLQMNVEQASQRRVFQYVDAIEIGNGKVTEQENDMARQVAERLDMDGVAGSDAHLINEVGKWITIFERDIQDEHELVEELKAGRFKTGSAR